MLRSYLFVFVGLVDNKEKEKLKVKQIAANSCHPALRERDNVTQLKDCGPQLV